MVTRVVSGIAAVALALCSCNDTGPAGPIGPTGPAGPKGDTGQQGSAGPATQIWIAVRDGGLGPGCASASTSNVTPCWAPIPGLSVSFTLAKDSVVQFNAGGSQVADNVDGGNQQTCHVGYRYTVDGVSRGDTLFGQVLLVNTQEITPTGYSTGSWWAHWSLLDSAVLSAGTHTVEVDGNPFGWNNEIGCWICTDANTLDSLSECQLQVLAIPK